MSNYVKIQISPMYLHKAQNPRACHIYVTNKRWKGLRYNLKKIFIFTSLCHKQTIKKMT